MLFCFYCTIVQDGALFVYNDAKFTDEDWDGIRSAGFSQKREKVDKVGRFGIGFSSVYHLTGKNGIFRFHLNFHSVFHRLPMDPLWNKVADYGPNSSTPGPAHQDVGLL